MDKLNERKRDIKENINSLIKLVDIKFIGIKRNEILINIGKILKRYGKSELIPEVEKFHLFDFERIEYETRRNILRDDKLEDSLSDISKMKKIYSEYKSFLEDMKSFRDEVEGYYIDTLCGLKLIYTNDLRKIKELSDELEVRKRKINREKVHEMLRFCSDCLRTTIYYELKQRETEELTMEINREIDKTLSEINICKFIDKISINCNIILDISDEILFNKGLVDKLKRNLSEDLKKMIIEYYKIK